jgi:tetraacyldisaccharide 4'-kinase
MDDGHQNFSLAKDLSLLVIAAGSGFGNNRMLPAGPLREPVMQGLKRADALIVHGTGVPPPVTSMPVAKSKLVPLDGARWSGLRVYAFAGIANPERFFALLTDLGATVVETRAFPDHHPFSPREIEHLRSRARAANAVLVTTEKDFVRLSPNERQGVEQLRVRVTFDEPELIDSLLDRIAPRDVQDRGGSLVRVEHDGSSLT